MLHCDIYPGNKEFGCMGSLDIVSLYFKDRVQNKIKEFRIDKLHLITWAIIGTFLGIEDGNPEKKVKKGQD